MQELANLLFQTFKVLDGIFAMFWFHHRTKANIPSVCLHEELTKLFESLCKM